MTRDDSQNPTATHLPLAAAPATFFRSSSGFLLSRNHGGRRCLDRGEKSLAGPLMSLKYIEIIKQNHVYKSA